MKTNCIELIDKKIGMRTVFLCMDNCISNNISQNVIDNRSKFLVTLDDENFCSQILDAVHTHVVYCFY